MVADLLVDVQLDGGCAGLGEAPRLPALGLGKVGPAAVEEGP
jgi:hypothetical protein